MPPQFSTAGNERLDKVTGRAVFASDITVPDMTRHVGYGNVARENGPACDLVEPLVAGGGKLWWHSQPYSAAETATPWRKPVL